MEPAAPVRYAGFWKRANAYGYDLMIVQLMSLVPMLLFFDFPSMTMLTSDLGRGMEMLNGWFHRFGQFVIVISTAYNIYYIASPAQATPGKRFCNCYVVNKDGSRLTLAQSALRHAMCAIGTVTWGLGFLTVAFTHEKLAPHDMICNTRVLIKPKEKKS
jgi:uncharacterized RDD family membrane protein YckC